MSHVYAWQHTVRTASHLLVMPISRMLLRASTPSILVSSWLTMVSWVPVPSRTLPRCLQMASISSKMMMCSSCKDSKKARKTVQKYGC